MSPRRTNLFGRGLRRSGARAANNVRPGYAGERSETKVAHPVERANVRMPRVHTSVTRPASREIRLHSRDPRGSSESAQGAGLTHEACAVDLAQRIPQGHDEIAAAPHGEPASSERLSQTIARPRRLGAASRAVGLQRTGCELHTLLSWAATRDGFGLHPEELGYGEGARTGPRGAWTGLQNDPHEGPNEGVSLRKKGERGADDAMWCHENVALA
ncbi:hypothetical protein Bcep1808_1990 [Burkholderia vietnamiensis G4]|uniref:Uncharacterized protein n=1 Tax=Burkholderia vietnamiensis (strain G4 / LMG 22486) TaxID=269482 RepID=A4JFE0_BURVG|nr:hypothetical protein Bcep1808_1990 [Burkholderia vietnamiensis G4]